MENYTHATQFYLRGEKMSKALHAAKQAELIALQILFIREAPAEEPTPCLLSLTTFQLTKIMTRKFRYVQFLDLNLSSIFSILFRKNSSFLYYCFYVIVIFHF